MADNDLLHQFETWAAAILDRLSATERKQLTRTIARDLRRSQAQRIAAQQNPDGSPYEPRQRLRDRGRGGRVRQRKMFAKLRTAKHLKAIGTTTAAIVEFRGRDARIARVSQYGLRDRVSPTGPTVRYPRRILLGFTDADRARVKELIMDQLTGQ